MANELAAKFCIKQGFHEYAKSHINAAIQDFAAWGAALKVEMLRHQYAEIISEDTAKPVMQDMPLHDMPAQAKTESFAIPDTMRLSTFIRNLREISSKNDVVSVIKSALELACVMSHAGRALLLLARDSKLSIEAEYIPPENPIMPADDSGIDIDGRLAGSIIHHVQKKIQPVFFKLGDGNDAFGEDPYITKSAIPAIACIPMVGRGELAGMIYLEYFSNGTTFTAETIEILNIIATQTTLSIGNSSRNGDDVKKSQYSRTLLKGVNTDLIYHRLMELMENEKIFKTEDLSLMMLAEELSLTPQQLSEFLNDRLSMNFNTFINKYRINEAKELLLNEPDRPITAIAYDLGFNTISVFYSAFLKFAGISPARFRKEGLERIESE
jgi:AraC-like DNA-binding protein